MIMALDNSLLIEAVTATLIIGGVTYLWTDFEVARQIHRDLTDSNRDWTVYEPIGPISSAVDIIYNQPLSPLYRLRTLIHHRKQQNI